MSNFASEVTLQGPPHAPATCKLHHVQHHGPLDNQHNNVGMGLDAQLLMTGGSTQHMLQIFSSVQNTGIRLFLNVFARVCSLLYQRAGGGGGGLQLGGGQWVGVGGLKESVALCPDIAHRWTAPPQSLHNRKYQFILPTSISKDPLIPCSAAH